MRFYSPKSKVENEMLLNIGLISKEELEQFEDLSIVKEEIKFLIFSKMNSESFYEFLNLAWNS